MSCIICESPSVDLVLHYRYCTVCNLIFSNEDSKPDQKEEKDVYLLHNNTFDCEGYVAMFRAFIRDFIEPYAVKEGESLDYGCGPGPDFVLSSILKEDGYSGYRYDPFFSDNEEVFEKKYDLISSTEVFEHFHNPLIEIERITGLLKKGGILSIMTLFHTVNEPTEAEGEKFSKWWYHRDPTHLIFFNRTTIEKIAEMFNLEIVACDNKRAVTFRKR